MIITQRTRDIGDARKLPSAWQGFPRSPMRLSGEPYLTNSGAKMQTLKGAKAALRTHGMTITKRDGEYRVNFLAGKEESAYYTNDIDDAVATGIDMKKRVTATAR